MATKQEVLAPLNPEQKDAATSFFGKIELSAGAGAGKTKTIVARCQMMLLSGIPASKILVYTFTRKAANELKTRIREAIGPESDKLTVGTYHSVCGRILRKFHHLIGRKRNFSIMDSDDQDKLLNPIIKEYFKGLNPLPLATVKKYISGFKQDGLSPAEAMEQRSDTSYGRACAFIYKSYQDALLANNAVDFDDLVFLCYKICLYYPEVLEYIGNTYDFIISDESQDSNALNMKLLLLFSQKHNNLFVVGDSDQSIYKFRGANVGYFLNTIAEENFERKLLSVNYRSTQVIVNASSAVIQNNKCRIDKHITSNNEYGEKIAVIKCPDVAHETLWIAQQIKKMHDEGRSYSDFAILCRTGSQTKNFEQTFLANNIPFKIKGVVPFFCRAEIKDIVGYLKYSYNENDLVALDRIINTPARKIGDVAKKKLFETLQDDSIYGIITKDNKVKNIGSNKTARTNLINFGKLILAIQAKFKDGTKLGDIIKFVIDSIGYIDYLKKEVTQVDTLQDKLANLNDLVHLANTYASIEDFLGSAVLDNTETEDKENEDIEGVSCMTMHGSKGLEFPVVFLAGTTDNNNPYYLSHDSVENIDEERRLFFVAMTRAEKELCITYPQSIIVNGREQKQEVSRFVKEIPTEYRDIYSICS